MASNLTSAALEHVHDKKGWTANPDGRGTMSIIWSCGITMFLCCWSVLVNNVPGPGTKRHSVTARKLMLVGLNAAAPEVFMQISLGQWLSARRSVKLFHGSGYTDWTRRHGFFVDMGGLQLQAPDYSPFPINSEQLHFLVTKKYVQYPKIEESQIRDRNKVDGMLRFITLVQTTAFMVNIIARAAQNLVITAIELSTAAFVFSSVVTTIFWLEKPADVYRCETIKSNASIAVIRLDAGLPAEGIYSYTPMDFVGREEWPWSKLWMHGLNCLRRFNLAGQPQELPVQRFQNTITPVIKGWALTFFAVVSLVYFFVFIAAWNFSFPTIIEQTLWRASSIASLVTASIIFIIQHFCFSWYPDLHERTRSLPMPISTRFPLRRKDSGALGLAIEGLRTIETELDSLLSLIRNNSLSGDPALDAPARAVIITWFLGGIYAAARAYIVIADFIELRSLPASAYQTLDLAWMNSLTP